MLLFCHGGVLRCTTTTTTTTTNGLADVAVDEIAKPTKPVCACDDEATVLVQTLKMKPYQRSLPEPSRMKFDHYSQ